MSLRSHVRLAVSTLVLAALAVSDTAACPLGRAVDVEQPALPWHQGPQLTLATSTPRAPGVVLLGGIGETAVVVKALARLELRCGSGRGEVTLRFAHGRVSPTTTGFEPRVTGCVREALEGLRVRAGDDTLVRVALSL